MSFTSVTVTGTIISPQSNPVAGVLVQFTLSQAMTDGVTQIAPQTISTTTATNGTFSVALVANDDLTTTPAGTYYKVLIGEPNNTQNFNVVVPHASAPTVDLFQLIPYSSSAFVLAPSVTKLQAGTGITLSPASGQGIVTVTSTASGSLTTSQIAAAWPAIVETPENHGAKCDGKIIVDAAMASGSAVVTSAAGRFTVADVGKRFMVNRAGAHGSQNVLIASVLSYQSANQITLDAPATITVTNQKAIWGTDDTAAIKAAVNNAVALAQTNRTYYCEVWFSAGIYVAAGAQDFTQHGNAQIPLPYIDATTSHKVTLVFRGVEDASSTVHWLQPTPQSSGAVIASLAYPSNATDVVHGPPSVVGGPTGEAGFGDGNNGTFSNMKPVVNGVSLLLPLDHTQAGWYFYACAAARMGNGSAFGFGTVIDGDFWSSNPLTAGYLYGGSWAACGLVMPNTGNNDDCTIGEWTAEGICAGVAIGEHTHWDSIRAVSCNIGLTGVADWAGGSVIWTGDHSMDGGSLSIENCRLHILGLPISSYGIIVSIANYSPEDAGGTVAHISDAQNFRGLICVNSAMVPGGLKIQFNGGGFTGPEIIDLNKHPGIPDTPPTVPAASTNYTNPVYRRAFVKVTGGTGVAFTVDGQARALGEWSPVRSGAVINLGAYTVAPTWTWYYQ